MTQWIGFLRAINLGATRKFPKDAIVDAVRAAGGTDVETYINTGNVRFEHELADRGQVELALEKAFEADRGFAVPTIALTPDEMVAVAADAARIAGEYDDIARHYVSLLKGEPTAAGIAALEALSTEAEIARVSGRGVHLLYRAASYHQAKLTNTRVERHVGVATNRNLTVISVLASKWGPA